MYTIYEQNKNKTFRIVFSSTKMSLDLSLTSETEKEVKFKFESDCNIKFRENLYNSLCSFIFDTVTVQNTYLSPCDEKCSYNNEEKTYKIRQEDNVKTAYDTIEFFISKVHRIDVSNLTRILRSLDFNYIVTYDMHMLKCIEWRYQSLFNDMFQNILSYYFQYIVNGCDHEYCQLQSYDMEAYRNCQIDETNRLNLDNSIFSQMIYRHPKFNDEPIMPCIYALEYFDIFCDVVTNVEVFEYLYNNNRKLFDITLSKNAIVQIMQNTFSGFVTDYRKTFPDYETSFDNIVKDLFNINKYLYDLQRCLSSFRNVLLHIPLRDYFDIQTNYIVYDEERELAGKIFLVMRNRFEPTSLLMYDMQLSNKMSTALLLDYSCGIHTCANIINKRNPNYDMKLFIINITNMDSFIYNVRNFQTCMCNNIFLNFQNKNEINSI